MQHFERVCCIKVDAHWQTRSQKARVSCRIAFLLFLDEAMPQLLDLPCGIVESNFLAASHCSADAFAGSVRLLGGGRSGRGG